MANRLFRGAIYAAAALSLALPPLLFSMHTARAAEPSRMFPFVIPWDDATAGTVTDVSFLNGPIEPIVVKDGHFYGATSKRRVRFVGTAFAAEPAFPDHDSARLVAARVAKYGINLVRLHHMDNPWSTAGSIIDPAFKDHRHLSKTQLDRLDYLIAQLEKHGVYVDINLHVGRTFNQADGFPPSVDQLKDFDTRLTYFDRRMIDLEKEYAHDLLTHVNPYTGKPYTKDPGVAIVEITNEDSLVGAPWTTLGAGLATLPEPFRGELDGLWNKWLKARYPTTEALTTAWLKGVQPLGAPIVDASRAWELEMHGPRAKLTPTATDNLAAAPDALIDIQESDGTGWHTQAKFSGLTLHDGDTYTLSFRAKADTARSVEVDTNLDEADWHNVGLSETPSLGTGWADYRYTFTAHSSVPGHVRLSFSVGGQTGKIWISGLTLAPGMDVRPIQSLNLNAENIPVPAEHTPAELADWICFLADQELRFNGEMRTYLKHTLGVRANVICSQVSWGGMTSIGRERYSEFADNHGYWQHPSFPHRPWDPNDWTIVNTSMVKDVASGGDGTLLGMAEYRIAGKPYTISEYNHPAPSDFQAECVPMALTFAAAQDWDAVMFFDYGGYGASAPNGQIQGYFGIGSNPAKIGMLPAGAMLFRTGLLPAIGSTTTATLPVAGSARARYSLPADVWKQKPDMLSRRISVAPSTVATRVTVSQHVADAPPVLAIRHFGNDPVWVASSPKAQSVVGFVGGHSVTVGPATYTFLSFGNGFASTMLTPMDAQPIARSGKLLLTLCGRAENVGMVWNADRTSVGQQWGGPPVQVEAIPAIVALRLDGPRKVYALDPTGHRKGEVKASYENGVLRFATGSDDTMWYAVVK